MLDKRQTINFLYTLSFPMYGIGAYISGNINSPVGYTLSISIHILIILFYLIDIIYKSDIKVKINGLFFLMVAFQLSSIGSFFVALSKNSPFLNELLSYTRSAIILFPFFAFIIVCLYNQKNKEKLIQLTFTSLSILLFINVVGFYVFGLVNGIHNIEGRLSMPFIDSMYSGAFMVAIINLMVFYYLRRSINDPLRFSYLLGYFVINLVLLFLINSRLANLIFLVVFLLSVLNITHRVKGLFLIGIFFVPILLNIGLLLYQILSLPFFRFVLQRVDLKDISTFNGRSFAWQSAIDWLLYDRTGLIFGNGFNGQYFLHLMSKIAKLWGVKETDTHLHSTSLSTLVDQGLVGGLLLLVISYKTYMYYKRKLILGKEEGLLFMIMVFMLMVMQVDMFVYKETLGFVILSLLVAIPSINWKDSKSLSNVT